MLIVFSLSMLLSSALLFLVEPMLAKMLLPLLGGSPSVWNTCLVFFQALLLLGYLYAYGVNRWLGRKMQVIVHLALSLSIFAVLPVHLPITQAPTTDNPIWWLLGTLFLSVGLPFFLLSGNTPLLQRWFSKSSHPSARDPYFLYAASNVGSLGGLLAYPFLIEPLLRLSTQTRVWTEGYVLLVMLIFACGILSLRKQNTTPDETSTVIASEAELPATILRERLRWIALAFVPSSLMNGVTSALTTDVPTIPLFWVLPLALYLLSFAISFSNRPIVSHAWISKRVPLLILAALLPTLAKINLSFLILFVLYMTTLFAVCMSCNGELATSRPRVGRLTEFYLWIALGGVLGGIFNSILAPLLFSTVLEFPLVLIFAAFLLPRSDSSLTRKDWLMPLTVGLGTLALILIWSLWSEKLTEASNIAVCVFIFAPAMMVCLSFSRHKIRFALGVLALVIAGSFYSGPYGHILLRERNFFGVLSISDDEAWKFRRLLHGAIVHGTQSLDPAQSRTPLAYYTASGPAGNIMSSVQSRFPKATWAGVGLGAGTLACYSKSGEQVTFYEINPAVVRIASDPNDFTFLSQCAPGAQIILGDARLKLNEAKDSTYDLIVFDAFSGDSIPMHLLTKEALALYLRKLTPHGVLAFHVSNDYLDLAPVLGALANDAGIQAFLKNDLQVTEAETEAGKSASQWMVLARNREDLGELLSDPSWKSVSVDTPSAEIWTDDYSNLFGAIRLNAKYPKP